MVYKLCVKLALGPGRQLHEGRQTVVVQVSLSTSVKASLGAARDFTFSARLRSRATILSTTHRQCVAQGSAPLPCPQIDVVGGATSPMTHVAAQANAVSKSRSLSWFQLSVARSERKFLHN